MLTADPSLSLVYADSILTENSVAVGHAFGREPQSSPVTFEFILTENCTVGTSSTVASRDALIAAGLFDESFKCCEDFDLWLRMSFRGAKMNYDPAVHLYHALSSGSLSGDRYVMKKARIEVYEKTASTLPVSEQQRSLIRRLIDKTEAECQVDLLKQFLRARQYGRALETAQRANTLKNNWKLRFTIFGLRKVPAAVRYYHHLHERFLSFRNRIRRANALHKLKNVQAHPALH
ncbi:MAG: glycosyltransferase family 2 protein [Terriglobales bacterium]